MLLKLLQVVCSIAVLVVTIIDAKSQTLLQTPTPERAVQIVTPLNESSAKTNRFWKDFLKSKERRRNLDQLAENEANQHLNNNLQGYITFDPHEQQNKTASVEQRIQKAETVNEILLNLFPNTFTNIFSYSYASDPKTTTAPAVSSKYKSLQRLYNEIRNTTTTTKTTTTTTKTTTTTTTGKPFISTTKKTVTPRKSKTYSLQASISKEYRHETEPGHTQIVVEKIILAPTERSTHVKRNADDKFVPDQVNGSIHCFIDNDMSESKNLMYSKKALPLYGQRIGPKQLSYTSQNEHEVLQVVLYEK